MFPYKIYSTTIVGAHWCTIIITATIGRGQYIAKLSIYKPQLCMSNTYTCTSKSIFRLMSNRMDENKKQTTLKEESNKKKIQTSGLIWSSSSSSVIEWISIACAPRNTVFMVFRGARTMNNPAEKREWERKKIKLTTPTVNATWLNARMKAGEDERQRNRGKNRTNWVICNTLF